MDRFCSAFYCFFCVDMPLSYSYDLTRVGVSKPNQDRRRRVHRHIIKSINHGVRHSGSPVLILSNEADFLQMSPNASASKIV